MITVLVTVVTVGISPVYAAPAGCNDSLLGIPAWYRGMQAADCSFEAPKSGSGSDVGMLILKAAMNIIQALLVVVAYMTVFFVIKGGFGYMTAAGSPDGMSNAKKTITNALIGMVIAVLAASIVNAIAGLIK